MAATGLLVYAHPVSLPAWGLAVLLKSVGPFIGVVGEQRIMSLLPSAFLFLVIITPS